MQDFKRAVITSISLILAIVLFSYALFAIASPYTHISDLSLRKSLSGKLNYLVVGASQAQCAFNAKMMDNRMGCNSYNLSYDGLGNGEKRLLLQTELSRNKINTVVLELSYDTFLASENTSYTDASVSTLLRTERFVDGAKYLMNCVDLDNRLYVYSYWVYKSALSLISSSTNSSTDAEEKGSRSLPSNDYTISVDNIAQAYNQKQYSVLNYNPKTIAGFVDLINLCKAYNARVIVAVVPVSDNYIWCYDNLDSFAIWASEFCEQQNVEYYDFNLLKDRYTLFSDTDCYSTDTHHMSEKGSQIFTESYAKIIAEVDTEEDVSQYFYSTYQELKGDSPYMTALNNGY
jgi:hypothetical protein